MTASGAFQVETGELYLMPAHFGHRTAEDDGRVDEVTTTIVTFETDPNAAAALLPAEFELTDPATVIVVHAENRGVHYMAGRGYNLVGVNLGARFRGANDEYTGSYSLIMWESDGLPVVLGRELLGVPKLVAGIPDAQTLEGRRLFSVSEYGHKLVDAQVQDLAELDEAGVGEVQRRLDQSQWMAWRYLPALGGRGNEASCPTAIDISRTIHRAWLGTGAVTIHPATREQAPASHLAITALASLPVLNEPLGIVTSGSLNQGRAHRLS
jgi:acetoacetate decarboxylase